ncbi:MAG: autotransporter outer membrane beta-barrel domain-containing protein [Gammaproteobacteria bacterium]|nr:autotransporter outer membrane beta-barrel domain-containing protein [Gammaproteobacteria bacterium]NIR26432.1 autotransporter outer membrane beta-barrel domain-containing protein [Gammaproteobacteria bacterium]NIW11278.1 autotransporter domain-containing protein [Gammaproteobacteria bacterium]
MNTQLLFKSIMSNPGARRMKVKDSYSKLLRSLLVFASLLISHNVSAFTLIEIFPSDTPSNTVTDTETLDTQVQTVTSAIGGHIQGVIRGTMRRQEVAANELMDMTGINAGDGMVNVGMWVSGSYTDYEDDFTSTAFEGDTVLGLVGIDIAPTDNILLGVALGYENSDITTTFNTGTQESDGYTVAPYFGIILNNYFSIDGSFGYSDIDTDQFRFAPIGAGAGAIISSSPSSERYFATLNLNAITYVGNWVLGARGGALYAKNKQDAFTETSSSPLVVPAPVQETESKLKQWYLGGDVAYGVGLFEPFASFMYEREFDSTELTFTSGPQPSNDEDSYLVGAGVRYFGTEGLSASLEWDRRLGRDNFDEDRFSLIIRGDF